MRGLPRRSLPRPFPSGERRRLPQPLQHPYYLPPNPTIISETKRLMLSSKFSSRPNSAGDLTRVPGFARDRARAPASPMSPPIRVRSLHVTRRARDFGPRAFRHPDGSLRATRPPPDPITAAARRRWRSMRSDPLAPPPAAGALAAARRAFFTQLGLAQSSGEGDEPGVAAASAAPGTGRWRPSMHPVFFPRHPLRRRLLGGDDGSCETESPRSIDC